MRLSLHSYPSRPLRSEGGPQTSRLADLPIVGYRRQDVQTPGAHGQDRISARWYPFFTEVQNFSRFKLILVKIATTRFIQRRVISYRLLIKVKILGETSVKETETQCSLLPAALSFSLIGLSHEPGALGIIIYP